MNRNKGKKPAAVRVRGASTWTARRRRARRSGWLGVLALMALCLPAGATTEPSGELLVGDPVPALGDLEWLQGDPYETWAPGEVYLVQFWAPWCLPCVAEFPELSRMQDELRTRGLRVVGVAVKNQDHGPSVADFLAGRLDVRYTVAKDAEGRIEKQLMIAARADNLPMNMLVDRHGRLAWIGPLDDELRLSVEALLEDRFDRRAAAAAEAVRRRGVEITEQAAVAERSEDWPRAAELYEQLAAVDEARYGWALVDAYEVWMGRVGDRRRAASAAERFLAGRYGKDPAALIVLVSRIMGKGPIEGDERDLDLALRLATRAAGMESPVRERALRYLANVRMARNEPEEAARVIEELLEEFAPSDAEDLRQELERLRSDQGESADPPESRPAEAGG